MVDRDTAGFEVSPCKGKMGLRTAPIGELVFEDCFVPKENRIGPEGAGASIFNGSQEWERAVILASQLGTMQHQLEQKNYDFLGHKDRQIKTRGYRVALDEIEAVLLAHKDIEEAAVFAVPDNQGSQQIQAAVIPKRQAAHTLVDPREHISGLLPWYAVPGRIDVTESLPQTSSGKIDRRRLREQAIAKLLEQTGT